MIDRKGLLLVAGIMGGCGMPGEASSARGAMLPAAAYDDLPVLSLEDAGRLCAAGEDRCLTTGDQLAAVREDGAVVFLGPGERFPQLYLVPAGSTSPQAIGRAGSGPGEYRLVISVAFAPDGGIRAFDGAQRRLLQFSPEGALQRTDAAPMPDAPVDAGFVGGELRWLGTDVPSARGDSMPARVYLSEGGAARVRPLHDLAFRHPSVPLGEFRPMPQPFEPLAQFAFGPDGTLFRTDGARFVIERYGPTGALDATFGFDRDARPLAASEVADARERLLARLPSVTMRAGAAAAFRDEWTHHPAITRLRVLGDGSLWVRESPHAAGDSVSWVIFESPDRPRGRLVLGADDRVLGTHQGRLLVALAGDVEVTGQLRWATIVSRRGGPAQ